MKKIFAGLLVGTMTMAGASTVFAATNAQTAHANKVENITAEIVAGEATLKLADFKEGKDVYFLDSVKLDTSGEAISLEELTAEQKLEIEKSQREFEEQLKAVCKEAGYDYNTIIEKLETGTLADEELQVFNEAGLIFAVASQAAEMIQLEDTQEIIQMTKIVEKQ